MKIPRERFFGLITYELLLQNLDFVAKMHMNCSIYLTAHKMLDDYKKDQIAKLKGFFDENGLSKIIHGPFLDLNFGSLDRRIREVSLERCIETLEIAKLLDSEYITFHSGYRPTPYRKYRDEWLKNSIQMWKEYVGIAEKENIKINIENALEQTPELLIELVDRVGSANFRLCFDAGHFNAFSELPPLKAFDMLPPEKIGEIHLSDNDGTDDQHLPLGEGNIELDTLFKKIEALKIEPIFTSEPRDINSAQKDLAYLENKGII